MIWPWPPVWLHLLSLCTSLSLFQPQTPCWASSSQKILLAKGLCTCLSSCLECCSSRKPHGSMPHILWGSLCFSTPSSKACFLIILSVIANSTPILSPSVSLPTLLSAFHLIQLLVSCLFASTRRELHEDRAFVHFHRTEPPVPITGLGV